MKTSTADANRERERERWYECFARFSTDERWRNSIAGRVVGPSRRILLRRNEGPRRNEWLVAWDYPGRETGVEKPGSVSLDSIVIRFSILFLGLLVSFSFIFHPTGNGGETAVPSRTFSDCSLVCRPVGCSQSLKIADPLARWTERFGDEVVEYGRFRSKRSSFSIWNITRRYPCDFGNFACNRKIRGSGRERERPVICKFAPTCHNNFWMKRSLD